MKDNAQQDENNINEELTDAQLEQADGGILIDSVSSGILIDSVSSGILQPQSIKKR